jgi:tRNA dimethylallyltransferase
VMCGRRDRLNPNPQWQGCSSACPRSDAEHMALIVAVVGATAVGKSDLSLKLARELGAEIINADSMQLYRGMDIGTAKVTEAERDGIPHHLLDVWDVREAASVAEYQRLAREVLSDLQVRGVPAVIVGGSGLYVRALLDDMVFPGTDPHIRARLEAQLDEVGPTVMHERLSQVDPVAAIAILPTNARRIVRALEVVELTGQPFTASLPVDPKPVHDAIRIGLELSREDLDARIDVRVERMWDTGLVDEVRSLMASGLREGITASRALGYAQVLKAFDGECSLLEAKEETARATRRFARRQDSWFRRDPHVRWIDAASEPFDTALSLIHSRDPDAGASRA